MGSFEPQTFGAAAAKFVEDGLASGRGLSVEDAIFPVLLLSLLVPLYPALAAVLVLLAPRWFMSRRRSIWIAEGSAVLLLSGLSWLAAEFGLVVVAFGNPAGPVNFWPLWLLPGFAGVAGIAAIWVGAAPRGRLARLARH